MVDEPGEVKRRQREGGEARGAMTRSISKV